MNFNDLKKIGKYGMLVLVLSSGVASFTAKAATNTENTKKENPVIVLLRAFEAKNDDPRTLSEFFAAIIEILEDPVQAAEFKKEYPKIDIKKLIEALKKVQHKTQAVLIGLALKPFFQYLPDDLQDVSKLWSAINRRTGKKS